MCAQGALFERHALAVNVARRVFDAPVIRMSAAAPCPGQS